MKDLLPGLSGKEADGVACIQDSIEMGTRVIGAKLELLTTSSRVETDLASSELIEQEGLEGRHTLGRRSMVDVMHRLLVNPYLLPPKSCKRGIEKTTLLQIDLFVEDHDVEKFVWQFWRKVPVL